MKKQILLIVFIAAFVNFTKVYGQCTPDALHPIAGVEYTYTVNVTAPVAPATLADVTYDWSVITTANIIGATPVLAGTGTTFAVTGGSPYHSATLGTATIKITWTPELIAAALSGTNYYLVVKYTGTTEAACNASNINAYEVHPINLFQLKLENVDNAGGLLADNYKVCPSDIVSAAITAGTPATIIYDYGENVLYAKVTVKNFTGNWNLLVNHNELAGLAGTGEVFTLTWGTTIAAANPITDDIAVVITEQTALVTDDEVIYLKLTYAHHTFEGTTIKDVAIKVNATDKATNPDVSALCAVDNDVITQHIIARPIINSTTVATQNAFILP